MAPTISLTHLFVYLTFGFFASASAQLLAAEADPFLDTKRLTQAQLVEATLTFSPALPAKRANWDAARARIEQALALSDPTISYGLAPNTIGTRGLDTGQKFELSQQLPWPGKRRLRGEIASYEADAAREDVATRRQDLIAAAESLFADWVFVHEAIRINTANQILWQEFRRIAEVKYATGSATKQDALRAQVEFSLLEHQAIVLERRRREVLAYINALLNRPPDAQLPPPGGLPEPRNLPDAATLRAQALTTRPELKALSAYASAYQARTDLAQKEFYPDFKITTGYNSLWDREEKRFTVGVGINIPLYRAPKRAANSEARAMLKRNRWETEAKASQVESEVQRAFDQVEESRHVLGLYRAKLLPLAEETLEAAKSDYQAGSGDFLALVSAEKNTLQTQLQTKKALADYHQRLAELKRAVGGFDFLDAEAQRQGARP